mmetsp:Transcript_65658/g.129390  ORF Transcript_65658/g.129390 Transcript_65658/m.129390 type:complete len:205 (-) Transcript_65658:126-740(-)
MLRSATPEPLIVREETGNESVDTPSNGSNGSSGSNLSGLCGFMQLAAATAVGGASADVHHRVFDTSSSSYTQSSTDSSGNTGGDSSNRALSSHILDFLREKGIEVASLEAVDTEIMLDMIPKDEDGQLTSVGALIHENGKCSPCLFKLKNRCNKFWRCAYCHLPHKLKKNKKLRPGRAARLQLREKARPDGEHPDDEPPDGAMS